MANFRKVNPENASSYKGCIGATFVNPASAMTTPGTLAGCENNIVCPRFASSFAMGKDRVSNPKSLVGNTVNKNRLEEGIFSNSHKLT